MTTAFEPNVRDTSTRAHVCDVKNMNLVEFLLIFACLDVRSILPQRSLENSAVAKCLKPVLRDSGARNVYFICSSHSTFCPSSILLHISDISWVLFDSKHMQSIFNKPFFCVIASKDVKDMKTLITELKICHRGKIILVFPSGTSPHLEEGESLFEEAWSSSVIDIVVVLSNLLYCRVYSYVPYSPGECFNKSPVLVSTWHLNSTSALKSDVYFPVDKILNFHSCPIFVFHDSMETSTTYDYWLPVIEFLGVALNFTILDLPIEGGDFAPFDEDPYIVVSERKVSPQLHSEYVLPSFFVADKYVLAVPRRPAASVGWFRLLNEFSGPVWCGVLLSFLISILVFFIILRFETDFTSIVFFTLRPLLSTSIPSVPLHGRIYLMSWLLLCFVLSSGYLSLLLSKLSAPSTKDAIENLRDFIDSDLVIHTPHVDAQFVGDVITPNYRYRPLLNKIRYVDGAHKVPIVDRNRNDVAYFISATDYHTLFINLSYRILPQEVFMSEYIIFMMLYRPSVLENVFKYSYLRVGGLGIFNYIERRRQLQQSRFKHFEPSVNTDPTPLSIDSLCAIFVIWSGGCVLACGVFVFERFYRGYF